MRPSGFFSFYDELPIFVGLVSGTVSGIPRCMSTGQESNQQLHDYANVTSLNTTANVATYLVGKRQNYLQAVLNWFLLHREAL